MDERLKQRLVGAVVLVALAVIFVPMLLEGPGEMGAPGSNLPPPPEALDEGRIEPLELPPPLLPEEAPAAGGARPAAGAEEPAAAKAAQAPKPVPATAEPPPQAPPASPAPAAQAAAPAPAQQPSEAQPRVEPALSGWVVQVGSFTRQENAVALRDKLRGKGYAAFVEKARTGQGLVYRVRVGPELERQNADRLRERLAKDFGFKAIVTRYP